MNVFVFGAGASVEYDLPVATDFLSEAFGKSPFGISQATDEELGIVAAAIDEKFGASLGESMKRWIVHEGGVPYVKLDLGGAPHFLNHLER